MTEWISVKNSLPLKNCKVIVYCAEGVAVSTYITDDYQGGFFVNLLQRPCEHVTHWMPLPAPPNF